MRKALIAAVLFLACQKADRPMTQSASPSHPSSASSGTNLLALTQGGAVVARTAEAFLTRSAVRAIDGDPATAWYSPPRDPRQTLEYSLAAPALLDSIGFETASKPGAITTRVAAEVSLDGTTFQPLGTFDSSAHGGNTSFPLQHLPARYIRVTTVANDGIYATFFEIRAEGKFTQPPSAGPIDGCWTINGTPASFTSHGAEVSGRLAGKEDADIDGGTDGAMFRFAWTRGAEYGLAAVTIAADSRHLSGIVWHEQAIQTEMFMAGDWLGERAESKCDAAAANVSAVMRTYLDRVGYYPLYGLHFAEAGQLDEPGSQPVLARIASLLAANPAMRVRFIAHELRRATPAENLAVTQRELTALRDALVKRGIASARIVLSAAGETNPRREATIDLTRAMYSAVEMEVAR